MFECPRCHWWTNWCWLGLKRWQQYIGQTKISVCLLAGQESPGKQPIRDLCQAPVTKQLQQLWHSSEWWEQDNNNSNKICAVIPCNRSRSVKAAVGGPVLHLGRRHAVHLGNKVGTQCDSVNKSHCIYSKQASLRNVLPLDLKSRPPLRIVLQMFQAHF